MDRQKSVKGKQTQSNLLSNVLAQFDIQTQVNKMVVRTFDSLMRSNKQAFDFIKQSQHKFITFQQRLSKAQTYYQNTQMNINSKIQLTQNMSARLQQFSGQFWNSMKQNNNEIIGMNKKYDQLSMQKKVLQNKVGQSEKNIKKLQSSHLNLNDKINEEISKIYQLIKINESKVDDKFMNENKELRQLANSIIQSKSLLQSKSQLLTDLLKDLQIYKNDRPEIKQQLQKVFDQLQHRALKVQLVQMRGYVDSMVMNEVQRVNKLTMRLDTQIKLQQRDRKKQDIKIIQIINQQKIINNKMVQQLSQRLQTKIQQINIKTKQIEQKTVQDILVISVDVSTIKTRYEKQMPQIQNKQNELKIQIQQICRQIKVRCEQIKQINIGIQNINETISQIVNENNQRKEQMNNLKSSSKNQGNAEQQMILLFEKLDILSKQVTRVQLQSQQNMASIKSSIQKNNDQCRRQVGQLSQLSKRLVKQLQQLSINSYKQITCVSTQLKKLINQNVIKIQYNITKLQQQSRQLIQQKITSIKDQLDQLDKIHLEIKQFKLIFQKQLLENQQVNISVAQKMERVMSLFTKLKSDNTVKFELLTSDLQRRAIQLKSSLNDLQQIKKYLSVSNQCVNILLAINIFNSNNNINKQSSINMFNSNNNIKQSSNSVNNTIQQKQQLQQKGIKVTSILQGWILQVDETQQKIRYRGQNFSYLNRIKLSQMFLQYLVKQSQKIKGSILQNGKDVFIKVIQSNQDMFQQRKRVVSKRKPSQLPKLHL